MLVRRQQFTVHSLTLRCDALPDVCSSSQVRDGETAWGWGAVVNFAKKKIKSKVGDEQQQYVVDVLLNCATGPAAAQSVHPVPCPPDEKGEMKVIPVRNPMPIHSLWPLEMNVTPTVSPYLFTQCGHMR